MLIEEETKQYQELLKKLMVLNADLNEHEKTLSRVRNEYFELHKKSMPNSTANRSLTQLFCNQTRPYPCNFTRILSSQNPHLALI